MITETIPRGAVDIKIVYRLVHFSSNQKQDIILDNEFSSIEFIDNPIVWINDYKYGIKDQISIHISLEYPFIVTTRNNSINGAPNYYIKRA